MGLVKDFRNYLLEDEFKITIIKNKINIVNYSKLGNFDTNKIIIYYDTGKVLVSGDKLVISKLMSEEILITGKIKNIEMIENEK